MRKRAERELPFENGAAAPARRDTPQAKAVVVENAVVVANAVVNVRQHRHLHRLQATLLALRVCPGMVAKLRVGRRDDDLG